MATLFVMQYVHIKDCINHIFISSHVKDKTGTVSMSTVTVPNIDVKVWTQKIRLPQVNFLRFLTQP